MMKTGTTTDFKKKIIDIKEPELIPFFIEPTLEVKNRYEISRVNHTPIIKNDSLSHSRRDIEGMFSDCRLTTHRDTSVQFALFKNFGIPPEAMQSRNPVNSYRMQPGVVMTTQYPEAQTQNDQTWLPRQYFGDMRNEQNSL